MQCKRCFSELEGKQKSFCSPVCSKLYLKAAYRRRNKERLLAYNREYRKRKRANLTVAEWRVIQEQWLERIPSAKRARLIQELGGKCKICGTRKNLTINHRIPRVAGGTHDKSNLEVLCGPCNTAEYHRVVREALRVYFELLKSDGVVAA